MTLARILGDFELNQTADENHKYWKIRSLGTWSLQDLNLRPPGCDLEDPFFSP